MTIIQFPCLRIVPRPGFLYPVCNLTWGLYEAHNENIEYPKGKPTGPIMMLLVIVLALLGILAWLGRNTLVGNWHMDSVTVYQFEKNGKGRMILPGSEYAFAYTTEGNTLYIDFEYEGAKNAKYEYEVCGSVLTLNGGNIMTHGTYTLTS